VDAVLSRTEIGSFLDSLIVALVLEKQFVSYKVLLVQPFAWIDFSSRAFRFSAPSFWNSLLQF